MLCLSTQDYAYGKLQIVDNKALVTGIQKDDPGFLPVPAKDYSIKFPAVFPTGNEPDIDIPRGACVAAIVAAENSEGRSVKESNCFMPAEVNPEGAAGPITGSTPTELTVASNANLGEFSPGDNLVMVTEDNVISNYTMQTSTIESVTGYQGNVWTDNPAGFDGGIDTAGNVIDGNINTRTVPASRNDSDYQYGVYIDIQGLLGNYSGPLFSWNNQSGGNDKYFAYVIFDDDTESPKVDIYTVPSGNVYTPVYAPTGKNVKTLVITAKSGNTPASVTKGISTVASDAGLIIADYAGEGSILTFADPNPDLKFFRPGDVVQETTGYTRDYVKYGSGSWY